MSTMEGGRYRDKVRGKYVTSHGWERKRKKENLEIQ
jgi:hypothetical protein